MANEPKFRVNDLVKIISPSSPYKNLAGHIEQVLKEDTTYHYWVVFEFPPVGYKNREKFTEVQLASMNEYFGKSKG